MKNPYQAPRSGLTGVLFVFCVAALIAGVGFDLGLSARLAFWIGDEPGSSAAIGVAVAVLVIVLGRLAHLTFRRKGADDASAHS